MATAGDTRPCSSQGAKELSGEASRQDPGTTRGSRKSRTGCSVCKQKRRKCDETRPGCLRCRYHNIECPGYGQGIKWRPVNVPAVVRKQPNDSSSSNSRRTTTQTRTTAGGEQPKDQSQQDIGSSNFRLQQPYQQPGPWSLHSSTISPWLDVNVPQALAAMESGSSGSNVMTSDFVLDNLNVESFPASQGAPFDLDVFINPPFEQHPWQVDLQHLSYLAYKDDSNSGKLVSDSRDTPSGDGHSIAGSLPDSQLGPARAQADGHDYLPRPFLGSCSPSHAVAQLSTPPPQHALPNDKTGDIIRLFEQQISRSLSISDDPAKNSWLTDIWPLSSIYAPLYHALAAMTCLHGPSSSELSSLGTRHLECAFDSLHAPIIDGERSEALRADIAKTISLAYLNLWDPQSSGTGLSYLAEARTLVKQAAAQHSDTQVLAEKLKSLSMLIHAVLYLDVMSRFGVSNVLHPGHEGFTELLNLTCLTQPEPEQHIESLVGFAPTLFSLLSRLADLVAQVRRGGGKRSSLDQISKATDLRAAFERWTPDVDVDRWSDGRALLTNTIQTTEAYRWAALLLVRQAVPEIPWAQSQADLAHMSLSYLATIQSESSTTVAHTFPLLVAGVEAVDQDNKDWIRAKWRYMSETVNMSHSARFLEITEEVWQRREEFEQRKGYDSRGQGGPASTQDDAVNQRLANLNTTDSNGRSNHSLNPSQHIQSTSTNFPDSLAFKKGIDPLTRSGLTEYTVRGSLHFLTVMNDWKWERKSYL